MPVVTEIEIVTPTSSDSVLGVQGGEVKRFLGSDISPRVNTSLWPTLAADGANWGSRDSTLFAMSSDGKLGIVGATKASLLTDTQYAPIGVAGFALADHTTRAAWAGYFDVQHSGGGTAYGIEIAVKNKTGVNTTPTAYGTGTNSSHGLWLAAGGDSSYGGSPTNPCAAGVVFVKNASTWNKGILFGATSLTGTDGVTGVGIAISMAKGHEIEWQASGAGRTGAIRADNATASSEITQVFVANAVYFLGTNSKRIFQTRYTANAVNFVDTLAAVTGGSPTVSAQGDDSNVDLTLSGKGTGVVRFGTHTGSGDVAISGYITIKDSGGTTRKLAIVS